MFQANWYKAEQYCRFHGMHLASINSAEEQDNLEDHIQSFGEKLRESGLLFGHNDEYSGFVNHLHFRFVLEFFFHLTCRTLC